MLWNWSVGFAFVFVISIASLAQADIRSPLFNGPYATEVMTYGEHWDNVVLIQDFPFSGNDMRVEFTAQVAHPADMSQGPYPLVILVHGNHRACAGATRAGSYWPCRNDHLPVIKNYEGYKYLSEALASHGYIVASISTNGIWTAGSSGIRDLEERAKLIDQHINAWYQFNEGTLLGLLHNSGESRDRALAQQLEKFVGAVDMSRIGLMGHSRGGEAVATYLKDDSTASWRTAVDAALLVAPTDEMRFVFTDIPTAVLQGYCDGDVSTLDGVHYFDDMRPPNGGDQTRKHQFMLMGANHNFFNTVWTPSHPDASVAAIDDAVQILPGDPYCDGNQPGNQRLTEWQQRDAAISFFNAFFRSYLGNEKEFLPLLNGRVTPQELLIADHHVSYHAPDHYSLRRDLSRFDIDESLFTNALGGQVLFGLLTTYRLCGGVGQAEDCLFNADPLQQPHTFTYNEDKAGLPQLHLQWDNNVWGFGPAFYENSIPLGFRDVSEFTVFKFRAAVSMDSEANKDYGGQDFSIIMTDRSNRQATVKVSDYSNALYFPPGDSNSARTSTPNKPSLIHNRVEIPLSAFEGINLNRLASVRFEFDQTDAGELLLSELAFANPEGVPTDLVNVVGSANSLNSNSANVEISALFNAPEELGLENATVTLFALLNDDQVDLTSTGAASFQPIPGSNAVFSAYESPRYPGSRISVLSLGFSNYWIVVDVNDALISRPAICDRGYGSPDLTTELLIDDGRNAGAYLHTTQEWTCIGRNTLSLF